MTREELENNYTYKVVTRVLKKQFPFITDISVSDEDLSKYKFSIFLQVSINPYILGQMFGVKVRNYVTRTLQEGNNYNVLYLTLLFDRSSSEMNELQELMDKVIENTSTSSSIPHEMRVVGKGFKIGDFIVPPSTLPPDITTTPN
jgi:hypothetical protein